MKITMNTNGCTGKDLWIYFTFTDKKLCSEIVIPRPFEHHTPQDIQNFISAIENDKYASLRFTTRSTLLSHIYNDVCISNLPHGIKFECYLASDIAYTKFSAITDAKTEIKRLFLNIFEKK